MQGGGSGEPGGSVLPGTLWQLIKMLLQPTRPADCACVKDGLAVPAGRQWYRLSDCDLEEALADRLRFGRFGGLGLEDAVPDATTFSRFRIDLSEAGLAEAIFTALNAQLEQRGLFIKAGTMLRWWKLM
jgi:hypothetical protein